MGRWTRQLGNDHRERWRVGHRRRKLGVRKELKRYVWVQRGHEIGREDRGP